MPDRPLFPRLRSWESIFQTLRHDSFPPGGRFSRKISNGWFVSSEIEEVVVDLERVAARADKSLPVAVSEDLRWRALVVIGKVAEAIIGVVQLFGKD